MSDSPGWLILTKRYGEDIRQPSDGDLIHAIDELFNENIDGLTEGDYAEHPHAWLRYGFDDGPMYLIDAYRNRKVILLKYADQDDVHAQAELTVHDMPSANILSLWRLLAKGDVDKIRAEFPDCGW